MIALEQPGRRVPQHRRAMNLQGHQIGQGINAGVDTGGDHAGGHAGYIRTVLAGLEQAIVALTNGQFQRPLHDIIFKRCAAYAQKSRQLRPMVQQVVERLAQAAIGLHQPLLELFFQPALECAENRAAMLLMLRQPLAGAPRLLDG